MNPYLQGALIAVACIIILCIIVFVGAAWWGTAWVDADEPWSEQ